VRGTLKNSLSLQQTEDGLNEVLREHLGSRYWKKLLTVAVDLHEQPYHGQVLQNEDEIRGGKAKSGTSHFHVYATAYVVRNGRRVTLALVYVRAGQSMTDVLDALEKRLLGAGFRIGLWLADRGFCSVEALRWFSTRSLAYVPLTVRGKTDPPSASQRLRRLRHSQWARYTMSSPTAGQIEFDVAVVRRRRERSRQGKFLGSRTLLYCVVGQQMAGGVQGKSVESVAAAYRGRFGIESSYRQLGEGRFKTTSRSPVPRLLAEGIALVLRNLWVLCLWLSAAHPGPGRRSLKSDLTLQMILCWISRVCEDKLAYRTEIVLHAESTLRF
jgi:putative transposase